MILTLNVRGNAYDYECDEYEVDDYEIAEYIADCHLFYEDDIIDLLTKENGNRELSEKLFEKVYNEHKEDLAGTIEALYNDYNYKTLFTKFEEEIIKWYEKKLEEYALDAYM